MRVDVDRADALGVLWHGAREGGSGPVRRTFALLPPSGKPTWLVELGNPAAAAGLAAPRDDGGGLPRRAAWAAIRAAVRSGALGAVHADVLELASDETTYESSLLSRLEGVIGAGPLHVAVPVQGRRAHAKVVVRLTDRTGGRSWFAKVSISDDTARLVDHEAATLDRLGRLELAPVAVPSVTWCGEMDDRSVLVVEARRRLRAFARRPVAPTAAHFRAIADCHGRGESSLASTAQADRARALAAAEAAAPDGDRGIATGLSVLLDRSGDVVVPVGAWHGDWVPQNTAWGPDGLALWDWEFFEVGVPVGLDAVHFWFQRHWWGGGRSAAHDALTATRRETAPVLDALGVPRTAHDALVDHYRCVLVHRLLSSPAGLRREHLRLAAALLDPRGDAHGT